ncbi:hypothetical protein [Cupriavidus consociatus]|uniref:hypothetical protein n=1 Tax=Cupriavidus consociatus TaxID=2821357 RepID=UPI001AE0F862|nr:MULTISPECIES: hypothetical protein [unclassified Cupriavidus]MBP0621594.1 hypothetical protein [Cupriavidus sp. LEh25]MDK2658269.1 hypothetical protein [Cupriavidus sp. LEh21]
MTNDERYEAALAKLHARAKEQGLICHITEWNGIHASYRKSRAILSTNARGTPWWQGDVDEGHHVPQGRVPGLDARQHVGLHVAHGARFVGAGLQQIHVARMDAGHSRSAHRRC